MIKLTNVNKFYPVGKTKFQALADIDLEIGKGEFISIEGESGAGKSTLLHVLGLLDTFDSGEYWFEGTDVRRMGDAKASALRNRRIGFVMQDFALIPHKTVLFNVMLPLLFSKTPLRGMRKRALDALEQVGIAEQAGKRVNQLSGGQRQRVAIARALIIEPALILADEPTGALDSQTSRQILELLTKINAARGITIVTVTHSKLVSDYCRRKIVMADGRIVQDQAAPASALAEGI